MYKFSRPNSVLNYVASYWLLDCTYLVEQVCLLNHQNLTINGWNITKIVMVELVTALWFYSPNLFALSSASAKLLAVLDLLSLDYFLAFPNFVLVTKVFLQLYFLPIPRVKSGIWKGSSIRVKSVWFCLGRVPLTWYCILDSK